MDQDGPENPLKVRKHILMACIHDVLVIKHWHCLYIIQPCHVVHPSISNYGGKTELTCEISLFWKLFNEVLRQITERDNKFNPKAIMVMRMVPTMVQLNKCLVLIL